ELAQPAGLVDERAESRREQERAGAPRACTHRYWRYRTIQGGRGGGAGGGRDGGGRDGGGRDGGGRDGGGREGRGHGPHAEKRRRRGKNVLYKSFSVSLRELRVLRNLRLL